MSRLYLKNANLRFPVLTSSSRSLRNSILSMGSVGRLHADVKGTFYVEGLKDICLSLQDGDTFGLIGPNGAGKTALLKLMSGIYEPTFGTVERDGIITTLFDIGLGMENDATGYENIFISACLRGALSEVNEDLAQEIIEFSGLEEFIHLPIRTYSAGMRTRLAFSISTAINPDILLIDEVFGAGDKDFVQKSQKKMADIMNAARILVFSSHNNQLVRSFCKKAAFVMKGQILKVGPVDEVIDFYENWSKK